MLKTSTDGKVTVSLDAIGSINKRDRRDKSILEFGLKESKDFVENVPQVVKTDLTAFGGLRT
ncbi:MAG: hypothetical protein ACTS5A_03640 [Candidatus Hodgkinia cicadicola]